MRKIAEYIARVFRKIYREKAEVVIVLYSSPSPFVDSERDFVEKGSLGEYSYISFFGKDFIPLDPVVESIRKAKEKTDFVCVIHIHGEPIPPTDMDIRMTEELRKEGVNLYFVGWPNGEFLHLKELLHKNIKTYRCPLQKLLRES